MGYENIDAFETGRLGYLEELYDRIQIEGYKTQAELDDKKHDQRHRNRGNKHFLTHEIGCHVARDGELLVNGGHHWLAIAKALDLDDLPNPNHPSA